MTNNEKALELVQKCLDDWPYAATRVIDIMNRLEQVKALLKEQEADKNKYEYKYDHTDCLWYGSGNCPSTCSQYRDGWNDAMDYIFKDGKGYQPYRRSVKWE